MKLKKFFAGVVAAAMMLTMGATAAFAEEPVAPTTGVEISKVYKLEGAGTSPAETFNFSIVANAVSNAATGVTKDTMPVPTIGSAAYTVEDGATATGNEKKVAIDFTKEGNLIYNSVGVYDYTVSEVTPVTPEKETLGVVYDTKTYTMRVVVVNGETRGTYKINSVKFFEGTNSSNKTDSVTFTNTYTANALTVSKTVTGALGDKTKDFHFTVNFANENEAKAWTNAITMKKTNQNNETSDLTLDAQNGFTLKDGESVTFGNIPAGLKYTVTEDDSYVAEGYKTYVLNGDEKTETRTSEGTMTATAATSAFENNKGGEIDTGVILDNAPYIALLAIVAFGGVALILNKRRRDEE